MSDISATKKPAFTVVDNDTGKTFKVYASGRTEGFGANCTIINRIPMVAAMAADQALKAARP